MEHYHVQFPSSVNPDANIAIMSFNNNKNYTRYGWHRNSITEDPRVWDALRPDIPFGVLLSPVNIMVSITKNDRIAGIYGIYDRNTGERVYVGSSNNVYKRMLGHLKGIAENNHARSDLNEYDANNLVFMLLTRCHHHIGEADTRSMGRNELNLEELRQFLLIRPLKFGVVPDHIDINADAPGCIQVYRKTSNNLIRILGMKTEHYADNDGSMKQSYSFKYAIQGHDSIILDWDMDDFNAITDYSTTGQSITTEVPTMLANIMETASYDRRLAVEYGVPYITTAERLQAMRTDASIMESLGL